ncbi:MAG: queuosine precursor transporter [Bacteroidetes bacterium]|nr:queuosine precursor transporter [Bacteroidota bacterium]
MLENTKEKSQFIFMIFSTIFVTSLILTNVIGGKFFRIYNFQISCSIITYPITFMITDIISEVYGEYRANTLVKNGFAISFFITIIVWIANKLPIHPESPIDQESFSKIFGLLPGLVFGSMIAYLFSQFIDIKLFEFFRKLAPKHLWIRNNGSTTISQFVDTITVVTISLVIWPLVDQNCLINPINFKTWLIIVFGQYIFKAILALLDTPFVYLGVYLTKKAIFKK